MMEYLLCALGHALRFLFIFLIESLPYWPIEFGRGSASNRKAPRRNHAINSQEKISQITRPLPLLSKEMKFRKPTSTQVPPPPKPSWE